MCDTFVARGTATSDGSTVFGKNSDREPNEAQVLEFHPRREREAGAKVQLTYLTIPQVRETRAVLLSRPFWMWGAEIGANEDGVAVGNEAVWSKMPLSRKPGLTGMDMLRLALERSTTAGQALETIVGLLHDHGQGGICGYRDKRMTYHNSFIIADPEEAWVLETAGPLWAARTGGRLGVHQQRADDRRGDRPDASRPRRDGAEEGMVEEGRNFPLRPLLFRLVLHDLFRLPAAPDKSRWI